VADGRDHNDILAAGVLDRISLERRERVTRRVQRITDAPDRQVDDPGAASDSPADRLRLDLWQDRPVAFDHLRDEEIRRERDAGDALSVVERRRDLPGHEGSVSLTIRDGATDEALRGHDPALELGMP